MTDTTVAIVDGYSTGRLLAPTIHTLGGRTVHVPSSPEPPAILRRSRDAHGAQEALPYADAQTTAKRLRDRGVDVVVAGAESGVLYADELCARLGLSWNTPALSSARRDKFDMIERLRHEGLSVVEQCRSADPNQIHRWATTQSSWPIVIKPVMSTSSEDVFFCHDLQEIQVATGTIVGKRNFLDVVNADVLAQTYLDGPIYVVNSVSHRGCHTTSDVWQFDFERTPLKGIRMLEHSLLGPDFDHFADLIDYNNRALDALGIANGPSHTELKLTPNGPSMIETGARLMGATIEEVHFRRSLEKTQVDLTALSVSAPEEFAPWVGTIQKPTLPLSIIWVHFDADGFIDSDEGLQQLNEITSVVGRYGLPHVGDQITPAGDTTGQHGFIYLQNEDPSVVQRDARRVRRLVRDQALFSVAQRKAG